MPESPFFQGRYGKGNGQEFVKHFMVEFRRDNSLDRDWRIYSDRKGSQVSPHIGNTHVFFEDPPPPPLLKPLDIEMNGA